MSTSQTCGYISGLYSLPITCDPGYHCAFNPDLSAFACGDVVATTTLGSHDTSGYGFATSCYASSEISDYCDEDCQTNSLNRLCTDTASLECATYTFTDTNYSDLICANQAGIINVETTFTDAIVSPSLNASPNTVSVMSTILATITSTLSISLPRTGETVPDPFTQTQAAASNTRAISTMAPVTTSGSVGKSAGLSKLKGSILSLLLIWAAVAF